MLAFWPPPNAVEEIAANTSATLSREGRVRGCSGSLTDIGHWAVDHRRRMLARQNMDVDVFGVLVRGQNAHANHEPFFVQSHLESDFLNSGDQTVPHVGVAQTDVEQRRNPFLR